MSEGWLCEHGVWNSRDKSCNKCNEALTPDMKHAVIQQENDYLREKLDQVSDKLEVSTNNIEQMLKVFSAARYLAYLKNLKETEGEVQEYVKNKGKAWENLFKALQPFIDADNEATVQMIKESPGIGFIHGETVLILPRIQPSREESDERPNAPPPGENPGGNQPA